MFRKKRITSQTIIICCLLLLVFLSVSCQTSTQEVEEVSIIQKDQEWDLLWVTDSSGSGVADIYGEFIAQDLGIQVNVLDKWKGGLAAGRLLKALQGETTNNYDLDRMREYVREAEVIVIYGNPEQSVSDNNPWDWNCGQDFSKCYVNACEMDTFKKYIEDLKEIYSIIFSLREGKPTIIRAIDAYNPRLVSQCTPDGLFDECRQCWENYNDAIHQAADEMGVPVANVFDAWNGLDHTEDPNDKGYTQSDKAHANKAGATVIAELLRDLGYETIIP